MISQELGSTSRTSPTRMQICWFVVRNSLVLMLGFALFCALILSVAAFAWVSKGSYKDTQTVLCVFFLLLATTVGWGVVFMYRPGISKAWRWAAVPLPLDMYPRDSFEAEALKPWALQMLEQLGRWCAENWAQVDHFVARRKQARTELNCLKTVAGGAVDSTGLEKFRNQRNHLREKFFQADSGVLSAQKIARDCKTCFLRCWDVFHAFDMLPTGYADASAFLNACKDAYAARCAQALEVGPCESVAVTLDK